MKILILIEDITLSGGTERVAITLAKNFTAEGVECGIYSLAKKNESTFYSTDDIKIHYGDNNKGLYSRIEAIRLAKKNNMTMLIISMGRLSVEMSLLSRLLFFKRFCCYEHISFTSFSKTIQKIKIIAYRLSRGVVFLTHQDEILIKSKIPTVDIVSIENISSFDIISNYSFDKRQNTVLAIGRLTEQKNFSRLLDIWREINRTDWELVIAGEGPEKKMLTEKINRDGLTNVKLCGAIKDINRLYMSSKILTLTSRYEGYPMVLVEAQSFGLPAISFDCKTGPAEIIKHNSSGYVIPYSDDRLFIEKLTYLMDHPLALEEMGCKALENARRFTFQETKRKWFAILEKI
ncbi:glycosyltransferase [Citrobacter amalonaticus]|uniref:glycosyltransferase n=1 Tax=Citrobacter amalonaticus TaxID=35703 RepID=UPI0038909D97